ncbi:hypothetical protein CK203_075294 [Vitis vinifera]|uniref:Uncharacterized protein n=1 Tax=Vitis vinifera TaxID=29760 RepID=A0A438BXK5_VITVI|nr:hypothetical protein CK203_075294 [Vitis vinifera]
MSGVRAFLTGARGMGVCGSCGLTLYVSGIAPVPGYIDSGELSVVVRLPTVFFRWLGAIQNYLPLLPDERLREGVAIFTVVPPAKGVRTGCPDAPSDGFVSHGQRERDKSVGLLLGGGRAIITLRAADRDRGGGTWAMAGCCDNVQDLLTSVNDLGKAYLDGLCWSSGCICGSRADAMLMSVVCFSLR